MGYDSQAIYITSNQFSDYANGATFEYAKIRIFNKSQLYNNQILTYNDFVNMSDSYGTVFTIKPAQHFGTTSSAYLLNTEVNGGSSITLWRIDNPISTPTLTEQATIDVASYSYPVGAVQEGNSTAIDAGDCRAQDCVWRNGNLYEAFTTSHDWGSGNVDAIQYLEINTNSNNAIIDAVYGDASSYYIYPNIYVDNYGDMVMVFSRSSSSEYPSVRWTYRTPTDGSMRASQALQEGKGSYLQLDLSNRNRWGDYSGICLDPSSDNQVWFYGEWATNSNTWSTQFGSFRFAPVQFTNTVNGSGAGGNLEVNSDLTVSSGTSLGFEPNCR